MLLIINDLEEMDVDRERTCAAKTHVRRMYLPRVDRDQARRRRVQSLFDPVHSPERHQFVHSCMPRLLKHHWVISTDQSASGLFCYMRKAQKELESLLWWDVEHESIQQCENSLDPPARPTRDRDNVELHKV